MYNRYYFFFNKTAGPINYFDSYQFMSTHVTLCQIMSIHSLSPYPTPYTAVAQAYIYAYLFTDIDIYLRIRNCFVVSVYDRGQIS